MPVCVAIGGNGGVASTAVGAHESWINRGGYRNSAGEWCCGDNDCESPGQIAVTGKGWVIGGKEFVPFRRGHAKSGRKDVDLPPARPHTPLCFRTATRLVARRRCGRIRQISARFHKPTVAGVDHRGQTLRKVPRGQRGVPADPCGKEPRNHVCANLPTPCRLAWPGHPLGCAWPGPGGAHSVQPCAAVGGRAIPRSLL